jgi:16S rRNA processing protein RimM
LLEVQRDDGTTWLLPAVEDYVDVQEDADGDDRLVVTDPPIGLLEEEDR